MPEQDPLEILRDAWQQSPTPNAVRDLEQEDALTRQAVDWMGQAWQQMDLPDIILPRQARASRWHLIPISAAAAFLIGITLFLLNPASSDRQNAEFQIVAAAPSPTLETTTNTHASAKAAPNPSPRLMVNSPEQVQILSGKVRLTMLRGTQPHSATTTQSESEGS